MRISSAAHKSRPSREAGFSLVELLAVLAIMSLMVGAVVLSLPSAASPMERDTARLIEGVQAELGRAALDGEMRAVELTREHLRLLDEQGDPRDFAWPEAARVSARSGDTVLDLAADEPPTFWIEPYGAVPDVSVQLSAPGSLVTLEFDERGRFTRDDAS